ncbi:MAG: hypothetical protein M1482_09510 [Chloroflexi bacterium]|nr:hypothetical protein [Chloroflexota bacterium]
MPSKLSVHLSGYPNNSFDILGKIQPSVVKVFNQSSEMNVDEIRRRCGALIIYREFVDVDYHTSADTFYFKMKNSLDKLRGRGIIWEGLNEPVTDSVDDAKALNAWYVRFAEIMHAEGELVAGFSWSTGNPTPAKWNSILPYIVDAAAATDVHAFHEYYSRVGLGRDWGLYRTFEQALPASARKPVVVTEAGYDDNGQPNGGYLGKITAAQYLEILKQYDQVLLQDPYVLGATIFQWGDGSWPSFDLSPEIKLLSDYIVSVGQGAPVSKPWTIPSFGPVVAFAASPAAIYAGQQSTLTWNVASAQTVTLDGQSVAASGSTSVAPAATTTYTLHVVFSDGSTQDLTATVTVTTSTAPLILQATLSPSTLQSGDLLNVSVTVKNDTTATIATEGPDPGFVYDEGDTFYARGYPDVGGALRVGVDFEGHSGIDHPYRWGLGAPLTPGQSVTVTGAIRLKTAGAVRYWVGLVREQVEWLEDNQGAGTVTVKPAPANVVQITRVSITPATLNAGQVLNVSITVTNNTANPLTTQGPDPGFVYDEGDTVQTRGFSEQRGACRVGIDFDGRTGIDHPYRWGLGTPLGAGSSAAITGAIRLRTPQTINYWAGLVDEQIAWLQDGQGKLAVAVGAAPRAVQIVSAVFSLQTGPSGAVLNVAITVFNNTSQTITTQNPDPGQAYAEGDTFYTRNFPDVGGAYRVGVDFDGRTGIDHPYRWGLGGSLAAGRIATITGTIALSKPQTVRYWAGLVREQNVWLQDNVGTTTITVTS